jgi:hypothetical protein
MAIQVGDIVIMLDSVRVDRALRTVEKTGIVESIIPASELYPDPPEYHPAYKGQRKAAKFPAGDVIYQVRVDSDKDRDGNPTHRGGILHNVHQSHLKEHG